MWRQRERHRNNGKRDKESDIEKKQKETKRHKNKAKRDKKKGIEIKKKETKIVTKK